MGRAFVLIFILFFGITFWIRYERLYIRSIFEADLILNAINVPEEGVSSTDRFNSPVNRRTSKFPSILLSDRTSLDDLTHMLLDKGLISDSLEFKWVSKTHGWRVFQKGYYEFPDSENIGESLDRMGRGIQSSIPITILPGLTLTSLASSLARQLEADSTDFDRLLRKDEKSHSTSGLESFEDSNHTFQQDAYFPRMLPNTYFTYWNVNPEVLVNRISQEFLRKLQELRNGASPSVAHLSDQELITLASIVEWEARYDEERRTISGLYHNRLKRGMKLQADPTVNFAIGERRRLRYRDYQFEHPYNTYIIQGLPPGPITNPSLESLEAAYHPEEHEYLFMVATPEGRHEFNQRYEDHLVAAQKWQDWIEEQYRIRRRLEREAAQP